MVSCRLAQTPFYGTPGGIMLPLTNFPSAKSILLLRHFINERQHAIALSSPIAVTSLAAFLRPLFDLFRKTVSKNSYVHSQHTNRDPADTLCVYDAPNHRAAVALISGTKATYLCLRDRIKTQPDDRELTAAVHYEIAIRYFLYGPILALNLIFRDLKRRRLQGTRIISLHGEIITYMYTRDLLNRLAIRPNKVCISDCFATRSVATVDHFQKLTIPVHMIQHGLIANAAKYRSHADIYYTWSNYEKNKLRNYVHRGIEFRHINPPIIRSTYPFCAEDRRLLVVLNPIQGIGRPYPSELLCIIAQIAKTVQTTVRLHPTDNRDAFIKNATKNGLPAINLSSNFWIDDLNRYSYFLVLNSTCILDIIYSNKIAATLGRQIFHYSPPSIADVERLADVCSANDLIKLFRTRNTQNTFTGIIEKTLGIITNEN